MNDFGETFPSSSTRSDSSNSENFASKSRQSDALEYYQFQSSLRQRFLCLADARDIDEMEKLPVDDLVVWSKKVASQAIGIAIRESGQGKSFEKQ